MDAGTDKDDGIFYYSNGLNDLKALADKSMEDFVIAECTGFGAYEGTVLLYNVKYLHNENRLSGTLRQGSGVRQKYR